MGDRTRSDEAQEASRLDDGLADVGTALSSIPHFGTKAGRAIRTAIDDVIDPVRTGRWSVAQLEKVEKTYIGTRVEITLRSTLNLEQGARMDCLIASHEVDIKFSIHGKWMIPMEAVGEMCLLVSADDEASTFSVGLLRARDEYLTVGGNRDRKRTLNAQGNAAIEWLVRDGDLPPNPLSQISPEQRSALLKIPVGQARVTALFRLVTGQPVTRSVVEWAASQLDPAKRVRDARQQLESEGIRILSGLRVADRSEAKAAGIPIPGKDEFVSYRFRDSSRS